MGFLLRPGSRADLAAIALLALGAVAGLYSVALEPYWIEVTRHTVPAAVARPITLAHITDLHTYGLGRREERLLSLLEDARPDAIVMTGDHLVDSDPWSPALGQAEDPAYAMAAPVLRRLKAPLGVYAVRGTWEEVRHTRDERGYYQSLGVRFLLNEAAELVPGVWLAGLGDSSPNGGQAARGIPAGAMVVGLFHSPAIFDGVAGHWPLSLAGHTHGGQVRLPFLRPWLPQGSGPYLAGWYTSKGSRLYVSRGVGWAMLPVRFGCRPELALITLTPGASTP